jgi:hypothetical protein
MEHEGNSFPLLVFFTKQIMHEVWFSSSLLWHMVGISKPSFSAASRMVVPGSTSTGLLFTVILIISNKNTKKTTGTC